MVAILCLLAQGKNPQCWQIWAIPLAAWSGLFLSATAQVRKPEAAKRAAQWTTSSHRCSWCQQILHIASGVHPWSKISFNWISNSRQEQRLIIYITPNCLLCHHMWINPEQSRLCAFDQGSNGSLSGLLICPGSPRSHLCLFSALVTGLPRRIDTTLLAVWPSGLPEHAARGSSLSTAPCRVRLELWLLSEMWKANSLSTLPMQDSTFSFSSSPKAFPQHFPL